MTYTVKTMKSALLAATMAISLGVVPAFAGGVQTPHSPITQSKIEGTKVEIRFSGVYLETDAGVEKIYQALQTKVIDACDVRSKKIFLHTRYAQKRCETKLLRELVNSADSEALRQVHLKATGY